MSRCGLILGDQLSGDLATLRVLDPASDVIIMAEVADEAGYVKHHVQKIALFFPRCATSPASCVTPAGG